MCVAVCFIIYLFLAVLGLCCCLSYFICIEWEYSWLQCAGFSLWWLLVAGPGPRLKGCSSCGSRAPWLLLAGSAVVVVHGLSCSTACGIFLDQGLNLCPLHWQVDSYPLRLQGSPYMCFFFKYSSTQQSVELINRHAAAKPPVTFWHFIIFASCPQSLFLRNKTSHILVKTVVPPIEEQLVHILHKDMHPPWPNSSFH